ncbi:Methyltransferase type 11, partial [mine drainage metagenome]
MLDVGCSNGQFLEAAASYGIEGVGIEPELAQASVARSKGLKVRAGLFPESLERGEAFDIVAFNDSFEHLSDPGAMLRTSEVILNPGGVLILNLPDSAGVLYSIASALARFSVYGP